MLESDKGQPPAAPKIGDQGPGWRSSDEKARRDVPGLVSDTQQQNASADPTSRLVKTNEVNFLQISISVHSQFRQWTVPMFGRAQKWNLVRRFFTIFHAAKRNPGSRIFADPEGVLFTKPLSRIIQFPNGTPSRCAVIQDYVLYYMKNCLTRKHARVTGEKGECMSRY